MNKILFLILVVFSYSSVIAQVEVCETQNSQINDLNNIDKCVIEHKKMSNSDELNQLKLSSVLKKRVLVKKRVGDKIKISKELIKKIISEDKVSPAVSSSEKLSN